MPYWPKTNDEAERLVKTLEENIRVALIERENWKQELFRFLRQYRATSHSTTNVSPCEALNDRILKTLLPEPPTTRCKQQEFMSYDASAGLAQRDAMQKQKMKSPW